MNDREKVIEYILKQERNANNMFIWGINCFSQIDGVFPECVFKILADLKTDKFVSFSDANISTHSAFPIYLLSNILHYFENKSKANRSAILETVKWLFPTIISLIALYFSVIQKQS